MAFELECLDWSSRNIQITLAVELDTYMELMHESNLLRFEMSFTHHVKPKFVKFSFYIRKMLFIPKNFRLGLGSFLDFGNVALARALSGLFIFFQTTDASRTRFMYCRKCWLTRLHKQTVNVNSTRTLCGLTYQKWWRWPNRCSVWAGRHWAQALHWAHFVAHHPPSGPLTLPA